MRMARKSRGERVRKEVLGLALGLSALLGTPALADPRLDEVVYSPYIENHMFELETRVGQEIGRGSLTNARTIVVEQEVGLNDRVSLALVETWGREPEVADRLKGLGLE